MAFPVGKAEAQGVHSGYTYTQRVCQEYGQQPRWYQVRDEMAGSDWRSSGGWAIVLERGVSAQSYYEWDIYGAIGVTTNYPTLPEVQYDRPVIVSGGRSAYPLAAEDPFSVTTAIVDNNEDGVVNASDNAGTPGQYYTDPVIYHPATGGVYVRWANMRWCR